jgi:hypothetical protein
MPAPNANRFAPGDRREAGRDVGAQTSEPDGAGEETGTIGGGDQPVLEGAVGAGTRTALGAGSDTGGSVGTFHADAGAGVDAAGALCAAGSPSAPHFLQCAAVTGTKYPHCGHLRQGAVPSLVVMSRSPGRRPLCRTGYRQPDPPLEHPMRLRTRETCALRVKR